MKLSYNVKHMKVTNKKAYHDYQVLDNFEAGVVLTGGEAKAVRAGRVQLGAAYVKLMKGEVWLINAVIPEYEFARVKDYDPGRTRKLLLSKKEILKLSQKVETKGVTLAPLSMYSKRGLVKVEVGLAKGRKEFEKREVTKRKDIEREMERDIFGNS